MRHADPAPGAGIVVAKRLRRGSASPGLRLTRGAIVSVVVAALVAMFAPAAYATDDVDTSASTDATPAETSVSEEPSEATSPEPTATATTAAPSTMADAATSADPVSESDAESTPEPDPTSEPDPIVVAQGSISVATTGTSASTLRVQGEAIFTSSGDVESLGGEGLTAEVAYRLDSGTTVTRRVSAVLAQDDNGEQSWRVALSQQLQGAGTVAVT
ncbi:hypothetical protein [Demequina salsinemoris]|uniref:hypothetical protein n=1 Tax=Demequina salsinemoris TaxID=577470 RepID=UPI000783F9E3|nr:hypothetical protein [Demequina salsinemoris]